LIFFPLTSDGCKLQVWTTGAPNEGSDVVHGCIYAIPYGSFLVLPAASIHGGGFCSKLENGDPRVHAYAVIGNDKLARRDFSNMHHFPCRIRMLNERFRNDPGMLSKTSIAVADDEE
jgi:hypothetical protein